MFDEIITGVLASLALGSVSSALAGFRSLRKSREREADIHFRGVEIRDDDGNVLYRDPDEAIVAHGDFSTSNAPEVVEVDEEGALTPEEVVTISRASTHAVEPSKRWYRDPAILALLGVLLSGLLSAGTVVYVARTDKDPPIDCAAYVTALINTHTANKDADAAVLFGQGGITFGRAENNCGPPEQFFEGLG